MLCKGVPLFPSPQLIAAIDAPSRRRACGWHLLLALLDLIVAPCYLFLRLTAYRAGSLRAKLAATGGFFTPALGTSAAAGPSPLTAESVEARLPLLFYC